MCPHPSNKNKKRYHTYSMKVTLNKHTRLLDEEEFEDPKGDSSGCFRLRGLVLRTTVDAAEEGMIEEHDPESGVLIAFSTSTNSLSEEGGGCSVVRGVLTDSEEGVEFAFFDGTFSPSGLNSWEKKKTHGYVNAIIFHSRLKLKCRKLQIS